MVAFVGSFLVAILLSLLVIPMAKRRPVGTPLTWGEAMVASTYAFALMFWVYGVVPHLWLTWADNELGWRPDKIVYGPGDILKPQALDGWLPFTITYQTLRDFIAVGIYVVFLVGQVAMWIWWQNRGKRAEAEAAAAKAITSEYGRPLVRKN
ncbi:MAG: hypothetical protein RLZZ31_1896 [Actinomycetota bacterium]|jgi:hypothetical protein